MFESVRKKKAELLFAEPKIALQWHRSKKPFLRAQNLPKSESLRKRPAVFVCSLHQGFMINP